MPSKILHRKIIHKTGQSFSFSESTPLTVPLHRHDEYELIYFVSGSGRQYIGASVREYTASDLILIGPNVPHLNLCRSVVDSSVTQQSVCEILQFPHSIFPEHSSEIKEYEFINSILENSSQGLVFHSDQVIKKVLRQMKAVNRKSGVERVLLLFRILDLLGRSTERTLVSGVLFDDIGDDSIRKIYDYLTLHFKKRITLKAIAAYANLPTTSLCRYFKQRTGQTIFGCLNEMRVGYACKLLSHSNMIISQMGYEAGFNNISNFNKQFKKITGQTPKAYKESLHTEVK